MVQPTHETKSQLPSDEVASGLKLHAGLVQPAIANVHEPSSSVAASLKFSAVTSVHPGTSNSSQIHRHRHRLSKTHHANPSSGKVQLEGSDIVKPGSKLHASGSCSRCNSRIRMSRRSHWLVGRSCRPMDSSNQEGATAVINGRRRVIIIRIGVSTTRARGKIARTIVPVAIGSKLQAPAAVQPSVLTQIFA